jgi:hypothetical protein
MVQEGAGRPSMGRAPRGSMAPEIRSRRNLAATNLVARNAVVGKARPLGYPLHRSRAIAEVRRPRPAREVVQKWPPADAPAGRSRFVPIGGLTSGRPSRLHRPLGRPRGLKGAAAEAFPGFRRAALLKSVPDRAHDQPRRIVSLCARTHRRARNGGASWATNRAHAPISRKPRTPLRLGVSPCRRRVVLGLGAMSDILEDATGAFLLRARLKNQCLAHCSDRSAI